jgi:hypothetical protein
MTVRTVAGFAAAIFLLSGTTAIAQGTKPAPKTAKPPVKSAPAPKATAPPKPTPPPAPPPQSDLRFKTTYTAGDQVTESTSFIKDQRERYELGDVILIKQRDQKRTIQISRSANAYVINPDAPPAAPAAAAVDPSKPPGVVIVNVAIVDTGERKDAFGQTARRVRTLIDRQPQPGACDQSKVRTETYGWYIDLPKALAAAPDAIAPPAAGSGCADEVTMNESGDKALLGFPIGYRTTVTDLAEKDAKPTEVAMEMTDFEVLRLEAALFDVPEGMTAAADLRAFAKSVSDANEAKLVSAGTVEALPEKKPGVLRVGVPELSNKTTQSIDTRALRTRFIAELENQKFEAIPLAAAPPAELDARAKQLGVDFLLLAEITDLKSSRPGGITRMMKVTAGEAATKDITEAKLNVQLVAPGSKPRLTKSANGKDGGVGLKTTLGVARFAGSIYLKMYMGGMYGGQMSALSNFKMMNMGAMGAMPMGGGGDRTMTAATYVMQNVMAAAAAGAASQGGPSYDAALENAIEDAGKDVVESLKKATPVRK